MIILLESHKDREQKARGQFLVFDLKVSDGS